MFVFECVKSPRHYTKLPQLAQSFHTIYKTPTQDTKLRHIIHNSHTLYATPISIKRFRRIHQAFMHYIKLPQNIQRCHTLCKTPVHYTKLGQTMQSFHAIYKAHTNYTKLLHIIKNLTPQQMRICQSSTPQQAISLHPPVYVWPPSPPHPPARTGKNPKILEATEKITLREGGGWRCAKTSKRI